MSESEGDKEILSTESEVLPSGGKTVTKKTAPVPNATPMQWVFLTVIAAVTAAIDLWSKSWAQGKLSRPLVQRVPLCPDTGGFSYQRGVLPAMKVIKGYLDLRYAENCGGAWGLLHGTREALRKPFFLLITVGASLFILYLYRTLESGQRMMRVALPLVLGGAIGNLIDRLRLGYVVDFIDAHWRDKYHWPTFNVADIAITVGIGLMAIEYVLGPKRAPTKIKPKAAAT